MSVKVYLPDNSFKEFKEEPTVLEVAASIGPRLAKDTLGAKFNDNPDVQDLRTIVPNGTKIKIITIKDKESLEVVRHSAAHVMAQAVQELWPQVKVTIGPVIDNGFYYDFDSSHIFTPDDLEKIEKKMQELIKKDLPVTRKDIDSVEAIKTFDKMGEKFKVELITDLKAKGTNSVGIYYQGEGDKAWFDLCRGPHVQRLSQVGAVKVLSLAGSYWRGDETRDRLQRVYATAFNNEKDLNQHLNDVEEAKKRDHRRLGKDLDLFVFHNFSPGAPIFTPKGATIYNELQKFIREKYVEYNYDEVITPQIFDMDLFKQSGHYDNYRDNMYFSKIDERDFGVKPMNCPSHCLLFGSDHRSYRQLPWRVADFGRLHRYERSGVMHGLTRVRSFCQDDAHIFCTVDQLQVEIESFMKMLSEIYQTLGMTKYHVYLSTRPEKRMGDDSVWDKAENALSDALKKLKIDYTVNPGDGAFYGPKLDIMFYDSINRPWQLGTLQCDFNMPKAFHLKYVGEDNAEHTPVMLHRAILGSIERFFGVYLEHTAGHLPAWMTPTQICILNVTDKQADYCKHLETEFKKAGFRARFDSRAEKMSYKIREAQLLKIPYMVVIGDKEKDSGTVSIRLSNGTQVNHLKLEEFINGVKDEVHNRKLQSAFLNMAKT
jgi:threonyl-tRNA synthetase